jgi:hypothetical protein
MYSIRRPSLLLFALVIAFFIPSLCVNWAGGLPAVYAQSATATLSGIIIDERSAVIAGVSITLLSNSKALERHATTDDNGSFIFPLLPPDSYIIRARRDGFGPVEIENVALNVNDQRAIRIQLRVGEVGDTVTIKERVGIEESAAVGTVIDRQFVENLPLNGRSFQTLIALAPGVVLTKATVNEQGQFSVNGQRANFNYFTVDGVSANTGVNASISLGQAGSGSLPGLNATGGTQSLVSVEALQEFKILTSTYAPEFGRTPGAQVLLITRSGSSEFHGWLFNYFRNDALDANDWFANRDGLRKPSLRQNNFGGVFGGPLIVPRNNGRRRTFFFLSYEGLRLRQPLVGAITVPSMSARQIAPDSVKPILNAYPVPNGEELGFGLARFSASYSDPTALNAGGIRLDQVIGSRHTFFSRYSQAHSDVTQRVNSLSQLAVTQFKHLSFTVGFLSNLGSKISNDWRANFSGYSGASFRKLSSFGGATPPDKRDLFPTFANPEDSLIFIQTSGLPSLVEGKNSTNRQQQINVVNGLSVTSGAHQLKFGFDYRRLVPRNDPRSYDQLVNFTGVNDVASFPASFGSLLSGRASSVQVSARMPVTLVFDNLSAYGQDDWHVTPRLTLTYGLRWEITPPPRATGEQELITVDSLDDLSAVKLAPSGTPLWQTSYRGFAPRIGFAYQLFQRTGRELTLRGGFGIFYDLGAGAIAENGSYYPFYQTKSLFSPTGISYPLDEFSAAPPSFNPDPPYSFFLVNDPHFVQPRVYQWNVTMAASVGTGQTVSAAYVGALGRHLLRQESLRNFNPNFFGLGVIRSDATSDYHALQLQWQRRLSRGLQALVSYTWSQSIDIASRDSLPTVASRLDPLLDRGPSDFDIRHILAGAAMYEISKSNTGWAGKLLWDNLSFDTIFRVQTAVPIDVIYSRDIGFGNSNFRPDIISGIPLYIKDSNAPGGRRINNTPAIISGNPYPQIGPFVRPAEGRQGRLGRNALRGFPLWQVDFALKKQFSLTERVGLQFRIECFNLFNHPNFSDPRNSLTDPLFGRSTSMLNRGLGTAGTNGGLNPIYQVGGPRSIQLALKLSF